MVKYLMGLGALLVVAGITAAAIPNLGDPSPPREPLGPNDYIPPLTQQRGDQIDLVDPRPELQRTCDLAGQWWDSEGCNLRGIIYSCYTVTGLWSRDLHMWKFDGYACRYSVESNDLEAPKEATR